MTARRPTALAPAVLVMGKGGVGKTTIAAGLAVLEAELRGRSVLLEFGDGESGRRALLGGHRKVDHVVVRPDEAIQRGGASLFGSKMLAKVALGNFAMRPLLRAAPAIRELAMLESVRQLVEEQRGIRVFVDMPATGHSVAWLRVPRQGRELLGSGPLFEMCDRVARELVSPGHASILVVTLPERLVIEETVELCNSITHLAGLTVDRIVVNRMPTSLPREAFDDATALGAARGPLAHAARALADVLAAREAASAAGLAALEPLVSGAASRHHGHVVWRVPLAPVDPAAADVARWLHAEGAA